MGSKWFKAVALFGFLLTTTELIFKLTNKSICSTQGCKVVAQSVKFSDTIVVLLGVITFLLLFILSFCKRESCENIIDALLITSLSAEGVFVGYQLFKIHAICLFCITVFFTFVLLTLLRLTKNRFVVVGFLSFFTVLFLNYLLKPVEKKLPTLSSTYTILYKKGCSHCEKVLKEARERKIKVEAKPVEKFLPILKAFKINQVPVLIVNEGEKKLIVVGEKAIEKTLFKEKESSPIESSDGFCPIDQGNCTDEEGSLLR